MSLRARWTRFAGLPLALLLALALPAARAHAYPWMIQHGYTNCSGCHVEPSGFGLLTEYASGRLSVRKRCNSRGVGGSPVRSKVIRRSSVTRSASLTGCSFDCWSLAKMNRSISLRAQTVVVCGGDTGFKGCVATALETFW